MKKLLLLLSVCIAAQSFAQNVPSYVPTNGLVGWWPFSGNAIDSSGNGNNGTVNGATLTTDRFGNANRAYYFNGNSQITCLNNSSIPTSSFSLSVWINQSQSYGNIEFICLGSTGGTNWGAIASNNNIKLNYGRGCGPNEPIALNNIGLNLNTWYHIVYVSNGYGGFTKVYINGNFVGTTNNILNGGCAASSLYFGIDIFSLPEYIIGKLDDIGIWNRALTPCEIQALYTGVPSTFNTNLITQDTIKACGDSVLVAATSGLNSYSWNTGATTASIYAKNTGWYKVTGANAQGCSAKDSVFVSILKANILNNDTTVCLGVSLTLNSQQAPSGISCTSSGLPNNLQNGLVGYWPFCGNANDMSGNGNNGTVNGATLTTDRFGNMNSAYNFNSINDYIITDTVLDVSQNFTYSCWVNSNSNNNQVILNTNPHTILGYNLNAYWAGPGNIGFLYGNGMFQGWINNSYSFPNPIPYLNVWVNHLIVKNGLNWKFYQNGNLIHTYNATANTSNIITQLVFGHCAPTNCNETFSGKIDDILLYNRALSASEVAQLYQASSYATTYLWSTGATTASINVTPTQTTKYWLQVSNGIATCTDTVTITVQNPAAPAVSNVSYCQGATASALTASASAGNSLLWYSTATGGTASSTAPMPSTTTVGSTTYYVSQITPQGCESARAALTVTINALPQASITASKTPIICTGDSVIFSVSPQVAGQSYVWYKDGILITGASNTSYAAKQSGAYSVKVTNSNGCSITSATSTLNVYPWPTVNAGADKEVPAGTSVDIITQTTNAQSIAWSPITGLSCTTCASPTATVNFPIVYIVTVTSAGGCSVSDTVAIQLVCEEDLLYMPNTFTPNGDGENDRFYPMGKGLGEVTVFRIVNRLGQVVYTRSRFAINNASYGWDGTFNGADLGMDVYSYYIEVPCATGQIIKKTGDISLLR